MYFAGGTLAAIGALAFAYLLQFVGGLEPCPLCIFQRIAVVAVALICLVGWVHGSTGAMHRVYAGGAGLAAMIGAAIAARHVWLMHLPADQVPACGPGLDYLIHIMPLQQVVATVLRGDASCATVKGAFAGLSLPAWSLIYFVLLTLGGLSGVFGVGTRRGSAPATPHELE